MHLLPTNENTSSATPWQIVHQLKLKIARERQTRLENESISRSLANQLHDSRQNHQHLLETYHHIVLLSQKDSQLIAEIKESIAREQRARATAEMEIESLHEVLQVAETS